MRECIVSSYIHAMNPNSDFDLLKALVKNWSYIKKLLLISRWPLLSTHIFIWFAFFMFYLTSIKLVIFLPAQDPLFLLFFQWLTEMFQFWFWIIHFFLKIHSWSFHKWAFNEASVSLTVTPSDHRDALEKQPVDIPRSRCKCFWVLLLLVGDWVHETPIEQSSTHEIWFLSCFLWLLTFICSRNI